MGIYDLFSKRQRRARGEVPDIYVYDPIPPQLKVQIVHIINDSFGVGGYPDVVEKLYHDIVDILCQEYGVFRLVPNTVDPRDILFEFITKEKDTDRILDAVEVCFRAIHIYIRDDFNYRHNSTRKLSPDDAINDLNTRFQESGIGYRFEAGEILRVDSEFAHSEIVKPTLSLLRGDGFAGANEEFLEAHQHYRHGRNKECLVSALKAFESVMKGVCTAKKWTFKPSDTSKNLIAVCVAHGLFPSYLESEVTSLRTLLESGVPTIRNRAGGHGQGAEPVAVPGYLARYALNLTASNALLLVEAASLN
ncbi:STM4504/CBY_0614 family protein [Burkholderia gladioli]|jgi:hypothetical protein|uniref:STM4504/CBY_0614 family protein n=1 Tax=Burkholderia gladioli TaxID=28095 RepID=UPI0016417D96|nr:hypothetical protein [Burkholderia gladioli]MBU9641075.1 hypothetical protein [Burkholderia gladioli]